MTRDPLAVASVAAAQQLPWLLFGLVGGAIADRVQVRKLIWVTNAARALLLAILAAAIVGGAVTIGLMLTVAFALGCAEALVDSAYPGMVVAVVEKERLDWANARLVAGNELAGPAIGGLLFTVAIALPVVALREQWVEAKGELTPSWHCLGPTADPGSPISVVARRLGRTEARTGFRG